MSAHSAYWFNEDVPLLTIMELAEPLLRARMALAAGATVKRRVDIVPTEVPLSFSGQLRLKRPETGFYHTHFAALQGESLYISNSPPGASASYCNGFRFVFADEISDSSCCGEEDTADGVFASSLTEVLK